MVSDRYSPSYFFFFNDTATTEIYTLSLHDALPILERMAFGEFDGRAGTAGVPPAPSNEGVHAGEQDRKSTRLNSSHANISYAVFCLKKKHRSLNLRISRSIASDTSEADQR